MGHQRSGSLRQTIADGDENEKDGKAMESAASASVERLPAYQVSTTLYMVLKKNPTLAGMASFWMRGPIGSWVRFMGRRVGNNLRFIG